MYIYILIGHTDISLEVWSTFTGEHFRSWCVFFHGQNHSEPGWQQHFGQLISWKKPLLSPNRNPTYNRHCFVDILVLTIGSITKYGFGGYMLGLRPNFYHNWLAQFRPSRVCFLLDGLKFAIPPTKKTKRGKLWIGCKLGSIWPIG